MRAIAVRIETLPPRLSVCMRHVGPYPGVGRVFKRMFDWATGAGVMTRDTVVMGLSYDNPRIVPAAQLRYDVCFSVPAPVAPLPDGARLEEVGGGRYAIHTLEGSYDAMPETFRHLFDVWLPTSGEVRDDRPCVEIYLNDVNVVPEADLRTELCVPLRG